MLNLLSSFTVRSALFNHIPDETLFLFVKSFDVTLLLYATLHVTLLLHATLYVTLLLRATLQVKLLLYAALHVTLLLRVDHCMPKFSYTIFILDVQLRLLAINMDVLLRTTLVTHTFLVFTSSEFHTPFTQVVHQNQNLQNILTMQFL